MQFYLDTWLIFRRHLLRNLRNPVWVVIGLTQPILYLAFFGPLAIKMPMMRNLGGANPWQIYVPGLLVQLGLFGASFVGFGIIADWRAGIIERMRVTPVSRLAMLLGRVLVDVCVLTTQAIVLIVASFFFGLRAPVIGVAVSLIFVMLLGMSLASLSYATGLIIKSEDAFAPLLSSLSVPIMLLSGVLLPISLGPPWLKNIAIFNPLYHIVEAMRQVFQGHYFTGQVLAGSIVAIALAAISLNVGTRIFRRENV